MIDIKKKNTWVLCMGVYSRMYGIKWCEKDTEYIEMRRYEISYLNWVIKYLKWVLKNH